MQPGREEGFVFETMRRHPLKVFSQVARDPLDAFAALQEEVLSRFEPKDAARYDTTEGWEPALRAAAGIDPDFARAEFDVLWNDVVASLRARGVKVGPGSFHAWNDGDAGLVRTIWTLIRHTRPETVIETGVAHGMTSRFILEALECNSAGELWSIDLPPLNPVTREEVGVAVDREPLRERWNYLVGTSRRRLPELLSRLRSVDLFIHDSMHSDRNMTFEMELAWNFLRPGGAMVVDDIDINPAFKRFADSHPAHPSFVCTAEPLSPDLRRFNQKGLFGVVLKRGSDA